MKLPLIAIFLIAFCIATDLDTEKGMTLSQARDLRVDLFTCDVDLRYFDFAILELTKWIEVVEHAE